MDKLTYAATDEEIISTINEIIEILEKEESREVISEESFLKMLTGGNVENNIYDDEIYREDRRAKINIYQGV